MGLLDDAIREHLDLKRRRGADPAEIERAEREALGPVRREPTMPSGLDGPPPAFAHDLSDHDDFVDEDGFTVAEADPFTEGVLPGRADDPDLGEADSPTMLHQSLGEAESEDAFPAEPARGIASPDYSDPDFDEFHAGDITSSREPRHRLRGLFHRRSHDHDHDHDHDGGAFAEEDPFADDGPFPEHPRDDARVGIDPIAAGAEAGPGEPSAGAEPALPIPVHEADLADAPGIDRSRPDAPPSGDEAVASSEPGDAHNPPPLQIRPAQEPGETVEYDVERIFGEEDTSAEPDPAEGPDLLEETPEFLADTPDHDRLWFEQKPPPDFDFEG